MNKGKEFEKNFANSARQQGITAIRLNDTELSFMHNRQSRFTAENPCDFIMYKKPCLFALELKSTQYSSMSIQTEKDEQAMIKAHQIRDLSNLSLGDGVFAGFILNFRNKPDQPIEETTYWLSIQNFNNFFCESDKKSINKVDIINYGGIVIDQKLKRKYFDYDVKGLLEKLISSSSNTN